MIEKATECELSAQALVRAKTANPRHKNSAKLNCLVWKMTFVLIGAILRFWLPRPCHRSQRRTVELIREINMINRITCTGSVRQFGRMAEACKTSLVLKVYTRHRENLVF